MLLHVLGGSADRSGISLCGVTESVPDDHLQPNTSKLFGHTKVLTAESDNPFLLIFSRTCSPHLFHLASLVYNCSHHRHNVLAHNTRRVMTSNCTLISKLIFSAFSSSLKSPISHTQQCAFPWLFLKVSFVNLKFERQAIRIYWSTSKSTNESTVCVFPDKSMFQIFPHIRAYMCMVRGERSIYDIQI